MELGRIYLGEMDDPIFAIYHFRKYLELKPNSPVSPMVRQMIDTAQKKFAASLPESPFENNVRRMELEELLQKVQKENIELKQRLDAAANAIDSLKATQRVSVAATPTRQTQGRHTAQTAQTPSSTQRDARQRQNAPIEVKRDTPATYTVQPGDTLSNVSRKVYGTKNRWREIFNANRDRMATPESLKPGQVLRIPR